MLSLGLNNSGETRISYTTGYIPDRCHEYRKGLKSGDIVHVKVDCLEGTADGEVISNNGTKITIQLPGNDAGKMSFRSFWVKDGQSCGPAVANSAWGYPWLFYYIVTPPTFGEKILKIIDLGENDVIILETSLIETESDIPF